MPTTIVISLITALVTSVITFAIEERRLRRVFRTEFMVERAAKFLLESERWKKRSFDEIKKRLGGFEDDELRKILVRAGAVRFESSEGNELWGLVSRNMDQI